MNYRLLLRFLPLVLSLGLVAACGDNEQQPEENEKQHASTTEQPHVNAHNKDGENSDPSNSGENTAPPAPKSLLWSFGAVGNISSSPAIRDDGGLNLGSPDNQLDAIDASDQSQLWAFDTGDSITSSSATVADDGTVHNNSMSPSLYAVDPLDGSGIWSFETRDQIIASPAIGNDGRAWSMSVLTSAPYTQYSTIIRRPPTHLQA